MKNLYLITFMIIFVVITGCKANNNSKGNTHLSITITEICGQVYGDTTKYNDDSINSFYNWAKFCY